MEIEYIPLNNYVEVNMCGETLAQIPDDENIDMWLIEKLSYWGYQLCVYNISPGLFPPFPMLFLK